MPARCSFVISARRSRLTSMSDSRSKRTSIPRSSSSLRTSRARRSVMSFSTSFPLNIAPLSLPPWLGSIITKNSGVRFWLSVGGVPDETAWLPAAESSCGVAIKTPRAQHKATNASPAPVLLQRINCQTAQQLGIEVSGFLRQYLAAKSDIANLLDLRRVHQERDVRALADPGDCFKGVSLVTDIFLVADCLFRNSQDALQHHAMQLDNIKSTLQCGEITQRMLNGILLCPH